MFQMGAVEVLSAPEQTDGGPAMGTMCCYDLAVKDDPCQGPCPTVGRPLAVAGVPVVARLRRRAW